MPPTSPGQSDHIVNLLARRSRTMIAAAVSLTVLANAGAQIGPVSNEIVELLPSDGQVADQFGASVSISGDTTVIGAPFGDGSVAETGSAYVFVQDSTGAWTQQTKLLASDAWAYHLFGASVAISGDTAIVGATLGDGSMDGAGAAYIFVRDTTGAWTQQAKLFASDGASADAFGSSVAISGDTAVIGAYLDGDACPNDPNCHSGSAYVFTRDATGAWSQQAKLLASDSSQEDQFGISVSINDDTVLIGAPAAYAGLRLGSAYVFVRDTAGAWSQQTKLLPSDSTAGNHFGASVFLYGDTAIVGATFKNGSGTDQMTGPGAAYVFVQDATGAWVQQAKLSALDGVVDNIFGVSVTINADTAIIGAIGDHAAGPYTGSAYVFTRSATGAWIQQAKLLASDGLTNDLFGFSVAIASDTALVGSLGFGRRDVSAAYAFSLLPPADLNGDGVVNGADLTLLLAQWGMPGSADLNNDGVVDATDLANLLANWG